ncbi:hypothetical protein [Luteococcus sanguinis]|uniref:Uncharacterized protein n=1 Tax=Luteococcus sanguinis TaxID=174038 RepID=A0ABW1X340_9ACTN
MSRTRTSLTLASLALVTCTVTACAPTESTTGSTVSPTVSSTPATSTPATFTPAASSTDSTMGSESPSGEASSTESGLVSPSARSTDTASATVSATATDAASASVTDSTSAVPVEATPRDLNAQITAVSQVSSKLTGTSQDFQRYITALAKKTVKNADGTTCPTFDIRVDRYWSTDDQAMGGLTACGGYEAIWFTDARGTWKEFGFQSVPYCSVVRAAGVPHPIDLSTGFGCIEKGSVDVVAYDPEG